MPSTLDGAIRASRAARARPGRGRCRPADRGLRATPDGRVHGGDGHRGGDHPLEPGRGVDHLAGAPVAPGRPTTRHRRQPGGARALRDRARRRGRGDPVRPARCRRLAAAAGAVPVHRAVPADRRDADRTRPRPGRRIGHLVGRGRRAALRRVPAGPVPPAGAGRDRGGPADDAGPARGAGPPDDAAALPGPGLPGAGGRGSVRRFGPDRLGGGQHGPARRHSGTARRAGTSTSSAPWRAGPASRSCPGCGSRR